MRIPALTLLVFVAVACQAGGSSARVEKLLGGAEGVHLLREAGRVQAYRIDGMGRRKGDTSPGRLHGYPVLAGPVAVDAASRDRLVAVFTADETYLWDIAKACEFLPGVLVRFEEQQRRWDVLICFSCDEVEFYLDGKKVGHEDIDPERRTLVAVARALFPDDAKIQALKS